MKQTKEWIPGEGTRQAPYDRPRTEELKMTDDAYLSRFGTDGELRELRAMIEARRSLAVPKKGKKTLEEIRARLADFEARFEAKAKAKPGRDVRGERTLELEMLGSWAGALRWALGEEAER